MSGANPDIGAIVLAAGLSLRMGKPKMLLPWGEKTVLETVIESLLNGGISRPIVVLGAERDRILDLLEKYPVEVVLNPLFKDGEMLHSLQAGLAALGTRAQACLIVLGDQPQIQASTVGLLIAEYQKQAHSMIIPSYHMHRGHPWLVARELWKDLLSLEKPSTLQDFINNHLPDIHYLVLDTPSILADLDTPEDYQKNRPAK